MADTHGANGIIGRLRRPGKNRLNPELTLLGTDLQRTDYSDAEEFAAFGSSPEFFHSLLSPSRMLSGLRQNLFSNFRDWVGNKLTKEMTTLNKSFRSFGATRFTNLAHNRISVWV
ncbi:hypothetical protein MTP99_008318 [Tenebrio molitor]|nr:hypothetical protein MTP99_008318 [Tenebrio molitor]